MLGSRLELTLGVSERPSWGALGRVQTGSGAGVGDGAGWRVNWDEMVSVEGVWGLREVVTL